MGALILFIFLIVTLYNFFRRSYEAFIINIIFFSIVFPAGLGVIIGGINFTYIRVASMILPLLIISIRIYRVKQELSKYFLPFLLILFFASVSSLRSEYPFISYIGYLVDDFFQTIGLIFVFGQMFNRVSFHKLLIKLLNVTVIVSFIVFTIGLVEVVSNITFFEAIGLEGTMNATYKGALSKGQSLRVSSIFNETLHFGYYVALILPLNLLALKRFAKFSLYFILVRVNIIQSIFLIYWIQSRTAIAMYLLVIVIIYTFTWWNKITNNNNYMRRMYAIFIIIAVSLFVWQFNDLFMIVNNFIGRESVGLIDESLRERTLQVDYIKSLFKDNNLFWGMGRVNTYTLIGDTGGGINALDSIWIRLLLESGVFSVLAYVWILIRPIANVLNRRIIVSKVSDDVYYLSFFLSYLLMSTFSSGQDYRILLFSFIFLLSFRQEYVWSDTKFS